MIEFLKKHAVAIALTAVTLIVLRSAYLATSTLNISINRWDAVAMNPFLEQTGQWAIRFLLISLSITPLRQITGWNWLIRLRKPTGLTAFAFVLVHASIRLRPLFASPDLPPNVSFASSIWQTIAFPWYIGLGFIAFLILLAMALTSHTYAIRRLKKNWKRLHRLVYLASLLGVSHALLNTYFGKRQGFGGEEARPELFLYLAILLILLALRLPFVQPYLRSSGRKRKRPTADLQTA